GERAREAVDAAGDAQVARVDGLVGLAIERLARLEETFQLGLRISRGGHRPAVALLHDALPVVVWRGAQPHDARRALEPVERLAVGDDAAARREHGGGVIAQEALQRLELETAVGALAVDR